MDKQPQPAPPRDEEFERLMEVLRIGRAVDAPAAKAALRQRFAEQAARLEQLEFRICAAICPYTMQHDCETPDDILIAAVKEFDMMKADNAKLRAAVEEMGTLKLGEGRCVSTKAMCEVMLEIAAEALKVTH